MSVTIDDRNNKVSVTFQVRAETRPGENIRVVGSSEELGSWDPNAGILLTTGPRTYPLWLVTVDFKAVPRQSIDVEYKYVLDCRALGGGFKLEGKPDVPNRQLKLKDAEQGVTGTWMVCDGSFGDVQTKKLNFMPACKGAASGSFEKSYGLIGEKLGFGAYGAVYRCWKTQSEEKKTHSFAAKQVETTPLKENDLRNLFGSKDHEGELSLHMGQKHPYIVELFDVFNEPTRVILVMDVCDGGDLFNYMMQHNKSFDDGVEEESAIVVLCQLLLALEHLHRQRIVHRDVKCENILLLHRRVDLGKNTCKLCDFGLAARLPEEGILQTPVGSIDYVAPEVLLKRYDSTSDLWSAGVILYTMLAGASPFRADTDQQVLKQISSCKYSLAGDAWDKVSDIGKQRVAGLLTKDQKQREETADLLRQQRLRRRLCIPVTFRVRAETSPGESIRVVGSSEELGCWDPNAGILLTTGPGVYPLWIGSAYFNIMSGQSMNVEYKYIVDHCTEGRSFKWESLPNRHIKLHMEYADDATMDADDTLMVSDLPMSGKVKASGGSKRSGYSDLDASTNASTSMLTSGVSGESEDSNVEQPKSDSFLGILVQQPAAKRSGRTPARAWLSRSRHRSVGPNSTSAKPANSMQQRSAPRSASLSVLTSRSRRSWESISISLCHYDYFDGKVI